MPVGIVQGTDNPNQLEVKYIWFTTSVENFFGLAIEAYNPSLAFQNSQNIELLSPLENLLDLESLYL